jgi:hypothetical protein
LGRGEANAGAAAGNEDGFVGNVHGGWKKRE